MSPGFFLITKSPAGMGISVISKFPKYVESAVFGSSIAFTDGEKQEL